MAIGVGVIAAYCLRHAEVDEPAKRSARVFAGVELESAADVMLKARLKRMEALMTLVRAQQAIARQRQRVRRIRAIDRGRPRILNIDDPTYGELDDDET